MVMHNNVVMEFQAQETRLPLLPYYFIAITLVPGTILYHAYTEYINPQHGLKNKSANICHVNASHWYYLWPGI